MLAAHVWHRRVSFIVPNQLNFPVSYRIDSPKLALCNYFRYSDTTRDLKVDQ